MNLHVRNTPGSLLSGYNFFANTARGVFGIEMVEPSYRLLGEVPGASFVPGDDWILEGGVVDDQISLRVWRHGDTQPDEAQLTVTESTHRRSGFAIENFASFHQQPTIVDGVWDDISFCPVVGTQAVAGATPPDGAAPLSVRLDGSMSTSREGTHLVSFQWRLRDGTMLDGEAVDHVFEAPGSHRVTLTVENDVGFRCSTTVTVAVSPSRQFRRADANDSGLVDMSDAVATLGFLFLGDAAPGCLDAADANDSGLVDISDAVHTLTHLFLGGPAPGEPFPGCGADFTADELGCESSQCP